MHRAIELVKERQEPVGGKPLEQAVILRGNEGSG